MYQHISEPYQTCIKRVSRLWYAKCNNEGCNIMKTKLQENQPLIITTVWVIGAFTAQYKGIAIYEFIILSCYAGMLYGILWGIQTLSKYNAPRNTPEIYTVDNTTW